MTELRDLSPEQQKVVETWDQGMAVMAGAGSGKTTTLVIKCAELLKRKPGARFAAVSFTEKSASDLRAKLAARLSLDGEGGVLSGHWVMTIHGLCSAILREYPREAGFDGEETMLSEGEAQLLWERALEQIWEAPEEIQSAFERLLSRESRDSLWALLRRARDLESMGVLSSLNEKTDEDSRALATLARFVLERYDRLKRRRGALDFNDLEQGADRALENPAVREAYQRRFELVLVDEFQDTNPVQARIILRFVKPDRSNLCVVGDPKQSIYRFREADVSVFEEFCERLPIKILLTWNFRSRPGILDFTNRVCEKAFEASEMQYPPLIPKKEAGEFEPVLKLEADSPQDLAGWIRMECDRGVPLQDMALLLRKIRGNEHWLKALTSAGIPIAVGSGGLFWEEPRTRELVAFLKWWDHPANSLSGAVFLRAPWVGIADQDLDRWIKEDPTWVRPFFASEHPLAKALAPLRNRILRPGELLMRLLLNDEIEAELGASLLGLWHRVEDFSSRGLDFRAIVAELVLATEQCRREREVPPPRNQGQLSVLTMHGSKGLEFRHVILVDLGKKNRAPNSPTLFWDRIEGAFLVEKDSEGERIEGPELERWKAQERAKEIAESKRVFYVALTRAQERLILVCPVLPEEVESEKVYKEDFWRGWMEFSGALASVPRAEIRTDPVSKVQKPLSAAAPSPLVAPVSGSFFPVSRPRHSVTEWNLLSRCPRAYEWTYVRPKNPERYDFDWQEHSSQGQDGEAEVTQRELGTEVHACLETGDFERLDELEKRAGSNRFQARLVRDWATGSSYMKSSQEAWAELAFEIPVGEQVIVGSMDRVVKTPSGLTVIDFKVTRHEKTAKALLEAYRTQMELYRWALASLSGSAEVPENYKAVLVNFSASDIQELSVPYSPLDVGALAALASRIVRGDPGIPRPGALCEVCQFSASCDARYHGYPTEL